MKLQEYQAKEIFARYDLPIPQGQVASSPEEVRNIARHLAVPVVVKAQVIVGGRGKAGGIKSASDPKEAKGLARSILGMRIKDLVVQRVLVEAAADIERELYLSVAVDRAAKTPLAIASSQGGMDIEEVASNSPEKIARARIDPFLGLLNHQARELAINTELERDLWGDWVAIAQRLYRAFIECDASLAEINPLAITRERKLVVLDAKMVIDDNALFRHPDLASLGEEDPTEKEAKEQGISYVRLEGNIGCLVNGAGLAMATMDVIKVYGGEPANFLDVGGGARAERVAAALRLLLSDPQVHSVLINVFGGITRCDDVAKGILETLREQRPKAPVVARLVGTNEEEGQRLLSEARVLTVPTLAEAAKMAVKMAMDTGEEHR